MIRRWASSDANFARDLKALLHVDAAQDDSIERAVAEILARVRSEGDAAVLEYTQRFDAVNVKCVADLEIPQSELQAALAGLPTQQRSALEAAAQRITAYHQHQLAN